MSFKAALYRLSDATELVPLEDNAFWSAYWTLPVSADTIFSSVSSNDIRYIRDSNLGNFCNLLRALSFHVIHLASKKSVPLNVFPTKELLTSVRILTKLMPYLYEMETLIPVEREIFWTLNNAPASLVKADSPADCTSTSATVGTASPGLSSSDDPSSSDSTKVNVDFKQKSSSSNESTKARFDNQTASQLHPLGPQLILAAINLLFTAGFTTPLPDGVDSASYAMNNVDFTLWEDGIGSQTVASGSAGSQYEPPSIDLDTHRLELIRLLLSLCSQCVYETVPTIVAEGSPFLSFLVSSVPKLQLLALLSSLINVACRSARTNSTSITNENGLIFEIADYRELRSLFVANSMQLLCLMLIYPLPKQHAKYVSGTSNLARYYCGRIYKVEEVVLLAEGFLRPLIRPISPDPNSSTFSNWMKSKLAASNTAMWNTEQIVLFWEFYQCNKRFRTFVAAKYAPQLILALLYNVWVFKNEKKQRNFVRLSLYLMLFLSSEPYIYKQLLTPIDARFYKGLPQSFKLSVRPTTYRDFLVSQIGNILCSDCMKSLFPTLVQLVYDYIPLATLCAPKNEVITQNRRFSQKELSAGLCPPLELSYAACSSVIQMINRLSDIHFLAKDVSKRLDWLALVIRAVCHTICRTPDHSSLLLYVMAKNQGVFRNVKSVIAELSKQQEARELESASESSETGNDGDNSSGNGPGSRGSPEIRPPLGFRRPSQLSLLSRVSSAVSHASSSVYSADDLIGDLTIVENEIENEQKSTETGGRAPMQTRRSSVTSIASSWGGAGVDGAGPGGNIEASPGARDVTESRGGTVNDVDPLDEDVVRPKLPVGMSERAKCKKPLFASLETTWTAHKALDIVLGVLDFARSRVPMDMGTLSTSDVVNRIAALPTEHYLDGQHVCDEYSSAKTSFEPLKFSWSRLSLGWYEAILWGSIYTNHGSSKSKRFLDEINSSLTTIKRVSANWWWGSGTGGSSSSGECEKRVGTGRKNGLSRSSSANSDSNPPTGDFAQLAIISNNSGLRLTDASVKRMVSESLIRSGPWSGTSVHLFKVHHRAVSGGSQRRVSRASIDAISEPSAASS